MVRFKNRYIAFEVIPVDKSENPLQLKTTTLHYAIQQKVQQLYGDFGVAAIKAGFTAKYCNTHTKIALVKVRHGPHKFLLTSIPLINDVTGRKVSIKVLYVGATLKHCFFFIRKHQQKKLEETWGSLKTAKARAEMERALMTLTPGMKEFR